MEETKEPRTEDVKAIFVYYSNQKNANRDSEIFKRFKEKFPPSFHLVVIQTNDNYERFECVYPRFIVADDFAKDLTEMTTFIRKSLQLMEVDDISRKEILKTLGYAEEPQPEEKIE